ncbi:4-carboxymuconolactone decarboxylase [Pseudomonas stutzeri]|uniref:4-carboxymuconolactone decarboxylase n=1 Tax=Stutzerimonas stutzeri KOS6 TaxID=1218352 RepID=A0A061JRW6_STUST|nr:carboxymuconolactone decarboxylase family protein [Stutzerimonas stutzeri]EWC42452.1 4-carboxymuconolactone decarboxylase [Stutzerimonas stutzeri KOS6]MBK3870215.1 4-carboxymuconolactone decarboxylase [Stutzerimonas stutzeri]
MSEKTYDSGLAIRHAMFGEEVTDRQIADASPFTRPIQDLVTEQCFGEVWSRPGLDRKTRSLATLCMLIGMGRSHELAIHVKGAVANGVTAQELSELMRHAAVYCGVPAAVGAAYTTDAALRELGISFGEGQA